MWNVIWETHGTQQQERLQRTWKSKCHRRVNFIPEYFYLDRAVWNFEEKINNISYLILKIYLHQNYIPIIQEYIIQEYIIQEYRLCKQLDLYVSSVIERLINISHKILFMLPDSLPSNSWTFAY